MYIHAVPSAHSRKVNNLTRLTPLTIGFNSRVPVMMFIDSLQSHGTVSELVASQSIFTNASYNIPKWLAQLSRDLYYFIAAALAIAYLFIYFFRSYGRARVWER